MSEKLHVVTGATGRTGFPLCIELTRRGLKVKACYRKESKATKALLEMGCELVICDVTDKSAVYNAIAGADFVYHLAGVISIETKPSEEVARTNILGTANVIAACLEHRVKRLIHIGSVHALFPPKTGIITPPVLPNRYTPDILDGAYSKSKAQGCNLVLDAVENSGLNAVIALPAGVIGPYEHQNTNFGEMVEMVATKKLRASIKGKYAFVDARDVALALCELAEKGVCGESYIISGHAVSVKKLLNIVADAATVKPIKATIPMFLARIYAPFAERSALKRNIKPTFTPYSLKVLRENCDFCTQRLKELTGYNPRPLAESINAQVEFIRNR